MTSIIFEENAFENVVCNPAAIVVQPQYVNIWVKIMLRVIVLKKWKMRSYILQPVFSFTDRN